MTKKIMTTSQKSERKKTLIPRYTVSFHRPKTLKSKRKPKNTKVRLQTNRVDHFAVVKFPLSSSDAFKKIEDHNTLVFIVNIRANKREIRNALHRLYGIETQKINTLIRPEGHKKAYVKLNATNDALEVASKL